MHFDGDDLVEGPAGFGLLLNPSVERAGPAQLGMSEAAGFGQESIQARSRSVFAGLTSFWSGRQRGAHRTSAVAPWSQTGA